MRGESRPGASRACLCAGRSEQRPGEDAPGVPVDDRRVRGQHLQADVVGSGGVVCRHSRPDHLDIAPGDNRIDQPIAAAVGEILFGEAGRDQVSTVVRQADVNCHMRACDASRCLRIGFEKHRLFGREQAILSEDLACPGRVFGRDEVGMRARRALAGEFEHLRMESGQHARTLADWRRGGKGRFIHRIEVAAHGRQRLRVLVPAQALDERGMTDAHAEEEAPGVGFTKGFLPPGHRHRVARPDVGDPGGDDESRASREQHARTGERFAAQSLGDPERAKAKILDLPRRSLCLACGQHIEKRPDADSSEFHATSWRVKRGPAPRGSRARETAYPLARYRSARRARPPKKEGPEFLMTGCPGRERACSGLLARRKVGQTPGVRQKAGECGPTQAMHPAVLLTANDLSKSHGLRELFRGVSIVIDENERIGLIGPNGAGKSTLLRMLADREETDDGTIRSPRGTVIVYVPQRDDFPSGVTARSVCTMAALGCASVHGDPHEAEILAGVVLGKIGFDETRMDELADRLSGGWQKRLSIASALASAGGTPDILFLDEPTNHLDVEGLDWLEDFILYGSQELNARSVIFVTHDRVFLENCATRIVELSRAYPEGTLSVDGNYTAFRQRRAEFLQMQARAEASLANEVREDDRWLSRGPQARRTKAKGRIEESGERRQELAGIASRNAAAARVRVGIDFAASGRQTRKLIAAEGIAKSMGGKLLFEGLDLRVVPGDCIGLMGMNGSGKTTLLRVLLGQLAPDAGVVTPADPAPRVVSMTQMRSEFPPGTTLKQAISPSGDKVFFRGAELHVTGWSRRFLFRDEQLYQQVSKLSGGELARAHVARMMLEPADVLVLDEPTNDLDIPTLEILEAAVEGFVGATLLVTHDRAMLERLASRIIVLGAPDRKPRVVDGLEQALRILREFEQHEPIPEGSKLPTLTKTASFQPPPVPTRKKLTLEEQREYKGIEAAIAVAEGAVRGFELELKAPEVLADHIVYAKIWEALTASQADAVELYARWEELETRRA